MDGEPRSQEDAKRLIVSIVRTGTVRFTRHADRAMAADKLNKADCFTVLRGGWVEPPEFESGEWRYRVRTAAVFVVVAFESETEAVVVTCWRKR